MHDEQQRSGDADATQTLGTPPAGDPAAPPAGTPDIAKMTAEERQRFAQAAAAGLDTPPAETVPPAAAVPGATLGPGDQRPTLPAEVPPVPAPVDQGDVGPSRVSQLAEGRPILTSGSAGADAIDLGLRLARLGYETSISRGENPAGVVDDSVLVAVRAFRQEHDVEEPPEGIPERAVDNYVGPYTWAALIEATTE